jgi:hypothetical protein
MHLIHFFLETHYHLLIVLTCCNFTYPYSGLFFEMLITVLVASSATTKTFALHNFNFK